MSDELRPAYRTLNEPTRLLGIALETWLAVIVAAALGYGWLLVSPLGWRASLSVAVVAFGAPATLFALREQSTISAAQLLAAVFRWRLRPARILAADVSRPGRRGAVRLDTPAATAPPRSGHGWPDREPGA